ncbi:hypothetical protein CNYM01_01009 [Colletotrichum nymphaeae SA-01]|uniref:Uncharacterized protein n=1 Tax=Colletotrichum nymphaeae SA-01 TaxID=1460502 RepID=A0A135S9D7_9PEZI|nr:hypothetical protein CNYM01_01009 [Colletotrichum nymphaeae SA-01]
MSFQASSEQFEELESPSTILTELLGNEDLSTWDPIGWPPVDLLIETDHSSALVDTALQDINPNLLDCVETNHLFQPTHCLEYDETELTVLEHRNQDVSSVSSIKSGMRRVKSFDDTKNDTNDDSNAATKSAP